MRSFLKYKLVVAMMLVMAVVVGAQGVAKADLLPDYYGGTANSNYWWCNVLGDLYPGYAQSDCVSEVNGVSHQYDSQLVNLDGIWCAQWDSTCIKARFIQYIHDKLLGGGDYELQHVGASYIVNTMRGYNAGRSIYPGGTNSAVYDDWVARVDSPNVTAQVITDTFIYNTAFDQFSNDVVRYYDKWDGWTTSRVLAFYVNGSLSYEIKLDCGNPVGNMIPLPQPQPTNVACGGLAINPTKPIKGNFVQMTGFVTYSGGPVPPVINSPGMKVSGPAGTFYPGASLGGGGGTLTIAAGLPLNAAGTYTAQWTININEHKPVVCSGVFTVWPPTVATCGSLTVSSDPLPNQPISITGTITYTGGPDPASTSGPSMTVTGPGSTQVTGTTLGGSSGTVTIPSNLKVSAPGTYTAHWSANINELGTVSCSGTFEVLQHPYVQVNGGDVVAGAGFAAPNSSGSVVPCSAAPRDTSAGIAACNSKTGPNYDGAGDEYAAYALSYIQEFATAQTHNPPTGLSFSNINDTGSVNAAGGMFGGMFGSVANCVDYWGNIPPSAVHSTWPGGSDYTIGAGGIAASGTHTYFVTATGSGPLMTEAVQIPDGAHLTVYIDGDLRIKGNITYQNSSWSSTNDIPSLRVIVHGSIFIDNAVTRLDGTYVAVPDSTYATATNLYGSPKPGTISTCSKNNTSYDPTAAGANPVVDCNNQLTVNGSFVANQIWLLRTHSTLGVAGSEPAEIFNYNPATWLAPGSEDQIKPIYQSVQGLPPVL